MVVALAMLAGGCRSGVTSPSTPDINETARTLASRLQEAASPRIRQVSLQLGDYVDPPSIDIFLAHDETAAQAQELYCSVVSPLIPPLLDDQTAIQVLIWDPTVSRIITSGYRPCGAPIDASSQAP